MKQAISVREFRFPDDYAAVCHLWAAAGPGVQLRHSDTPEEIKKKIQRDPELFLLAEANNEIIGTVLGGFDGRRGLVYHLAVATANQKQGIGAILMEELEKRFRAIGCFRCYLLVTKENVEAMRFYEKRGWAEMNLHIYAKDLT